MGRISKVVEHLRIEEVKDRMRNDPNPFYRKRWSIIYSTQVDPREAKDIARDTGVSTSVVHKLIPEYTRHGVAAIETVGKGGRYREYLTSEEEKELVEEFFERAAKGELVTTRQIKLKYEELVGREVHDTTITRLLQRHLWRKVMPRSEHPKADKKEQEEFLKNFPKLVKEAEKTKDPHDTRPTLLLVQDEGRFGRVRFPQPAWAPFPIRPQVPHQIIREYTYAYAAIAQKLGKMSCLILPYSNTEMMNLFLKQVSEDFSSYFLLMQVDNARWHGSEDLVLPENRRLIYQPAYSPELNPTEHLWDEIRENFFANRCFSSLDEVSQALCDAFDDISSRPLDLRSLTFFPHLRIAA
jgi:transposase